MPKVSVIIPTYNRGRYIGEAVTSVLEQTFADWEIVVVDDGSTDDTPLLLSQLASRVPRLRHVRQPNSGLPSARNTGLRMSQGEYLVFLDSDDWLLPRKLEVQARYLDEHPEVGVVYSNVSLCDERGCELQLFSLQERRHPSGYVLDHLLCANFITVHSAMVRRACLEQVGPFDEQLRAHEDWELWLRVAEHWPFHYLDEPLAKYRVHSSMMTQDIMRMRGAYLAAREKVRMLPLFEKASSQARSTFYCNYGFLHIATGSPQMARQMLSRAVVLNPWQPRPYLLFLMTFLGPFGFRHAARLWGWLRRIVERRPPSALSRTL